MAFFLDEMSSDLAHVGYYREIDTYSKDKIDGAPVVGNPGVSGTQNPSGQTDFSIDDYGASVDVMMTFEQTAANYASSYSPVSWTSGSEAHVLYAAGSDISSLIQDALDNDVNYLYITDDGLDNPWDALSSSWTALVDSSLDSTTPAPMPFVPVCFSGQNTVETEEKGIVSIHKLKIGDKVRVAGKTFEPVYSFGHYDQSGVAEFLKIVTDDKLMLEISDMHMILVKDRGYVPASTVEVGDRLLSANMLEIKVRSIATTARQGMFAPFTPSGSIVVSGILASSYIAMQRESSDLKIGGFSTGVSFHFLAHALLLPARLACHHVGSCRGETYSINGIPTWLEIPFNSSKWLLQQNPVVMSAYVLPLIALGMIFAVIESIISIPFWALVLLSCMIGSVSLRRNRSSNWAFKSQSLPSCKNPRPVTPKQSQRSSLWM